MSQLCFFRAATGTLLISPPSTKSWLFLKTGGKIPGIAEEAIKASLSFPVLISTCFPDSISTAIQVKGILQSSKVASPTYSSRILPTDFDFNRLSLRKLKFLNLTNFTLPNSRAASSILFGVFPSAKRAPIIAPALVPVMQSILIPAWVMTSRMPI